MNLSLGVLGRNLIVLFFRFAGLSGGSTVNLIFSTFELRRLCVDFCILKS